MPTTPKDTAKLKSLGKKAKASKTIEVFPNHSPGAMDITLHCEEFTCLCPATGQPDYATLEISYRPDKFVAESKSMKLYLESYRNQGIFHEHLAVDVGKDFMKFVKPLSVDVTVHFNIRGGIAISATYSENRK